MSYPGDPQQPGGWGPSQPPQSPYGPGKDQAGHGGSSYDGPQGGGPYDDSYGGPPQGGGYGPGGGYGGSFGTERPDAHGGDFGRGPSFGEGPDAYGGGPDGYEPAGEPGEGDFRSGPNRKRLIVGAAVIAGLIVAGGGTALAITSGGDEKPKPAAAPTTAPPPTPTVNPTPSPTETGRGERLQSRATDPRPLTLNEIFKARSFKASGRRYYMTARRSERKCSPPTHGTAFRKALAKAGCTQVLRATFNNGKLIGTIAVINLRTQSAADAVKVASRQKDSYILALPGSGTTKKIGQGLSLTTVEVDGHYLIMSWVQYPTGKKIAKSDYSAVTSFVRNTTYASNLRTALNYRSMEGKPS
jgi:hypothetical protein